MFSHFVSAYLHQDWALEAKVPAQTILEFRKHSSPEDQYQLAGEIKALLRAEDYSFECEVDMDKFGGKQIFLLQALALL